MTRRHTLEVFKSYLEPPNSPPRETGIPVLAHLNMARQTMARIERLQRELASHLGHIESALAGSLPERIRQANMTKL